MVEGRTGGAALLEGARCEGCGAIYFPSAPLACRLCGESGFEAFELRPEGTVLALTHVTAPPLGFAEPYYFGLVRLDDGPSVFAPLGGDSAPGARVVAMPQPIRDGKPGFGFRTSA